MYCCCVQLNRNARLARIFAGDMYDLDGKLNLDRCTGKDLRHTLERFPFALAGVLKDSDLWIFHLGQKWLELCTLARSVTAQDAYGLQRLELLVSETRDLFLQLYRDFKEDQSKTLDSHPTFHNITHLVELIRMILSMAIWASKGRIGTNIAMVHSSFFLKSAPITRSPRKRCILKYYVHLGCASFNSTVCKRSAPPKLLLSVCGTE